MKISILALLITFCVIFPTKGDRYVILDDLEDGITDSSVLITPCLIKILKKYIQENDEEVVKGSTAIISQMIHSAFQQRFLLKGIHETEELTILMKQPYLYHYSAKKMIEKSKIYIIFLSNSNEILDHLKLMKRLPTYNTFAKIIVCFPNQMSQSDFERERKKSIEILFGNDFFDIFAIGMKYNTTTLESYTFFPFDNGNCAKKVRNIQLVDKCELVANNTVFLKKNFESFISRKSNTSIIRLTEYRKFFPKLPEHITNCVIPVTVSNFEPYVVVNEETNTIDKGVEVMIINSTFQEMEAKVKFRILDPKVRYYRTSLNNETGRFADILNK